MPHYGFGNDPFGDYPFGDVNYCRIVLWDELPEAIKDQDLASGGHYLTFVDSLAPSFQWIRNHIQSFNTIMDPRIIRHDLLALFAANFGITIDLAEPEDYQRGRASLAALWNIIKGTVRSYEVLCRVHGFEVEVVPLWWTGSLFSETPPHIYGENPTVTSVVDGGDTVFTIRVGCSPVVPETIDVRVRVGANVFTVTDTVDPPPPVGDGEGHWDAPNTGTLDYGWGYFTLRYPDPTATLENISYESQTGGCTTSCVKCKTHRLRLKVTPGAIAGQTQLSITEAFQRLYRKLGVLSGDGVIPIHVELEQLLISGSVVLSIGYHYDILEADSYVVDAGLHWLPVLP